MWNLTGTTTQQALARSALAACDFPFELMRERLALEGKTSIEVAWEDLSRYARASGGHYHTHGVHTVERVVDGRKRVLGLFYLPPHTRVVLDASLVSMPELAREVLLAEAAHAVDYHYMTPEHRRAVVNALHRDDLPVGADTSDGASFALDGHSCSWFDVGAYADWVGEAFMECFIESFAPSVPVTIQLNHPTGPEQAAAVRAALLPVLPPIPDVTIPPLTGDEGAALAEALTRFLTRKGVPTYLRAAAEAWLERWHA